MSFEDHSRAKGEGFRADKGQIQVLANDSRLGKGGPRLIVEEIRQIRLATNLPWNEQCSAHMKYGFYRNLSSLLALATWGEKKYYCSSW